MPGYRQGPGFCRAHSFLTALARASALGETEHLKAPPVAPTTDPAFSWGHRPWPQRSQSKSTL